MPVEDSMEALAEVVRAGKARYLGFSEWTPEQIEAGLAALPDDVAVVSSQPQYSMLWRPPEAEVLALTGVRGIGNIVWSPLAEGVLTGKYRPGEQVPVDSRAASPEMNGFIRQKLTDRTLAAVQRLVTVARGAGLRPAELALAWVLRRPEVSSAIVGASRPQQVHANAAAAGIELTPDTLAAVDEALGDVPVTGPRLAPGASEGVRHR